MTEHKPDLSNTDIFAGLKAILENPRFPNISKKLGRKLIRYGLISVSTDPTRYSPTERGQKALHMHATNHAPVPRLSETHDGPSSPLEDFIHSLHTPIRRPGSGKVPRKPGAL